MACFQFWGCDLLHKRSLKKRIRLKNKKLLKKYPWLWPVDWRGNKITRKRLDYDFTWIDEIPRGWRIAFGMLMIKDIDKELRRYNYNKKFHILQIKEKYGEMRFYHAGAPGEVDHIIDAYSHLSTNICVVCGKVDVPMVEGGWISPFCEKCYTSTGYYTSEDYNNSKDEDNMMITEIKWSRYSHETDKWEQYTRDISEYTNKVRKKYETKALYGHSEH